MFLFFVLVGIESERVVQSLGDIATLHTARRRRFDEEQTISPGHSW